MMMQISLIVIFISFEFLRNCFSSWLLNPLSFLFFLFIFKLVSTPGEPVTVLPGGPDGQACGSCIFSQESSQDCCSGRDSFEGLTDIVFGYRGQTGQPVP